MKAFALISVLFITSFAAPISEDAQATIVQHSNTNNGDGNYEFSFETSNGLQRSESGTLVNIGQPNEHIEVQGYYSYIDQNGQNVAVYYTADENGYHIREPISSILSGSNPALVASLLG